MCSLAFLHHWTNFTFLVSSWVPLLCLLTSFSVVLLALSYFSSERWLSVNNS